MDIPAGVLSAPWLWAASVFYLWILYRAVCAAPWARLRDNEAIHVFLGACVLAVVLWSIRASVGAELGFHLLGTSALTLMFGWPLAIVAVSLVLLGTTLNGVGDWETFGLNAVLMGIVPVGVTHGLLRYAQARLPHNPFVYLFVNAFGAGALAMCSTVLAGIVLITLAGDRGVAYLAYELLPYLPLIAFPEASLNGILISVLVGLRMHWVYTFDDDLYLGGK
jgi:uncharacterized membrane protein